MYKYEDESFNTIRLLEKFEWIDTYSDFKQFKRGDAILRENSCVDEIKRWSIEQKEEAKAELAKYKCEYTRHYVREYALEYFRSDDDGEFLCGSDYDFAEADEEDEDD